MVPHRRTADTGRVPDVSATSADIGDRNGSAALQRIMALAIGLLRSPRVHPSRISCEITDLDIERERAMFRA
jgi:hypothetical protein